jgi:hypothetical protein
VFCAGWKSRHKMTRVSWLAGWLCRPWIQQPRNFYLAAATESQVCCRPLQSSRCYVVGIRFVELVLFCPPLAGVGGHFTLLTTIPVIAIVSDGLHIWRYFAGTTKVDRSHRCAPVFIFSSNMEPCRMCPAHPFSTVW